MNRYVVGALSGMFALTVVYFCLPKQGPAQQETPAPQDTYVSTTSAQRSADKQATSTEEIITPDSQTKETLEGYYISRSGRGAEENPDYTYTCDSFVVESKGPLVQYFLKMYFIAGNTVNRTDPNKQLELNLNLSNLSAEDASKLKNSDARHPIKLEVQKNVEVGKGAPPCYSFVRILKAGG